MTVFPRENGVVPDKFVRITVSGHISSNELLILPRQDAATNGDIQDTEPRMAKFGDLPYLKYSLERTAEMLQKRYAKEKAAIIVVRPSRKVDSFSCFDNLLRPGMGIVHLEKLLHNAGDHVNPDLPICLIAFSKGVLVLNSFLAELSTSITPIKSKYILDWQAEDIDSLLPTWEESSRITRQQTPQGRAVMWSSVNLIRDFFDRVRDIHYVDGHRFPTNPSVTTHSLQHLKEKRINLWLHATPRQLKSEREWIRKEFEIFLRECALLLDEKNLFHRLYYEDEAPTMEQHFQVLWSFEKEKEDKTS
ncbi:hypothetical protein PROFUN_12290 [Planoprotostelium fungivorum]|uniref:Uncharacterized protein n=1 Tax=Planoprotostelium fungivorum TaxID=1890364 RepID=A0A2P6N7S5_9EUKA|nr:hypothetical protein PROFUN_12290 [Planoprotostelium fungivorum]